MAHGVKSTWPLGAFRLGFSISLEKENTDSVNDLISGNDSEKEIIARYNLQGIPVGADADGIIIVIYKNGSSSKILNTKK